MPLFNYVSVEYDELLKVRFGDYEEYVDLKGQYLTFTKNEVYNASLAEMGIDEVFCKY
jgi:hypothetical protein